MTTLNPKQPHGPSPLIWLLLMPMIFALFVFLATVAEAQTPPDDSAQYSLVIVTASPANVADAKVLESFKSNPALANIAANCKRFTFDARDPLYLSRYAAQLPPTALPVVAMVRSDGGVIYKASWPNIPPPDELAAQMLKMGRADRNQNPRTIQVSKPEEIAGPLTPWLPDPARPSGLIPDTVNINPTLNVPPEVGMAMTAAVALVGVVLLLGGMAGAAVFVWLLLRD